MRAESTTPSRILAADIGGTHARFAAVTVNEHFQAELGPVFTISTRQPGVGDFAGFWKRFQDIAPAPLAYPGTFDAVALALAGSVAERSAVLPHIDWDITAKDTEPFQRLYLLNDFVAQGHALSTSGALVELDMVRQGKQNKAGLIALVGAGTGLGHCALHPRSGRDSALLPHRVAGSEAGHASFSFQGEEEKAIERRWLERTGTQWLSNDDVISGSGAVALHACITGETVSAEAALGANHSQTADLFSRFYGRACRNYCLNVFPVACLVLSGGVTMKNPHIVRAQAFSDSFNDGLEYRDLLSEIPILLNNDPMVGIRGAAVYAALKLRQLD